MASRKLLMSIGITTAVLLPLIALLLFVTQKGLSLYLNVTDFVACSGEDGITGKPTEPISTISQNDLVSRVYACGFLETDGRPAILTITVRDENGKLIDVSKRNEWEPGYFYYPIAFEKATPQGGYTINLYNGRTLISTWMIEIKDK